MKRGILPAFILTTSLFSTTGIKAQQTKEIETFNGTLAEAAALVDKTEEYQVVTIDDATITNLVCVHYYNHMILAYDKNSYNGDETACLQLYQKEKAEAYDYIGNTSKSNSQLGGCFGDDYDNHYWVKVYYPDDDCNVEPGTVFSAKGQMVIYNFGRQTQDELGMYDLRFGMENNNARYNGYYTENPINIAVDNSDFVTNVKNKLNVFIVVNLQKFTDDNSGQRQSRFFESSGTTSNKYLFVRPNYNEVGWIKWAQWDASSSSFIVPTNNSHGFSNSVKIGSGGFSLNDVTDFQGESALVDGRVYNFLALFERNHPRDGYYAPQRRSTTPDESADYADFYYTIIPLELGENSAVTTGVEEVGATFREVKHVRYYDLSGHESVEPYQGINIVVSTFADGSKEADKVVY